LKVRFTPIANIEQYKEKTIRLAGFITDAGHLTTKKGAPFGKIVLNDYSGSFEIPFWNENYVKYGNYIQNGQLIMVQGVYKEHKYRSGVMEFHIQNISLLDDVRRIFTKKLSLAISLQHIDQEFVDFIHQNLKMHPGKTDFHIRIYDEENKMLTTELKLSSQKIEVNDSLIKYLSDSDHIWYKLEIE